MKTANLIRFGAASAIGLAMAAALLALSSNLDRADSVERAGAFDEKLATHSAQALKTVDLGLAVTAQQIASIASATDGVVPADKFASMAQSFFAKTNDVQAVVFFERAGEQDAAKLLAQPIAEGITQFNAGGQTFFLAASRSARNARTESAQRVFSGSDGRLPYALAAGDIAQQTQGAALGDDLPVASGLFALDGTAIEPITTADLSAGQPVGFWRFLAVRGSKPDGSSALAGLVGAFVDATTLFTPSHGPAIRIAGPVDAIELPETSRSVSDGTTRQVAVLTGKRGFVLSFSTPAAGVSGFSWLLSLLGGLIAGCAALWGSERESRARIEAERRLDLHKREFKKRSVALKRSEDRFRRLAESTNVIPWAADLKERRFNYIGPQIERVSGYPAKSWAVSGFWVDHVHPDDRHRVFAEKLDGLKAGEYATIEYRIRSANGRVVHMRNMLTLIDGKTKSGEPTLLAQGYMLDITEMQTAQDVLDEARRAAEEANRSKSEFLANMSHELRTPLNAVIGFAEVMKDEVFGPMGERYREYAENVHSSGKHLLSLINDVLDLSKIEAGKIELVEEETEISSLLSKCRQLLHERAAQAGLHIRLEIPAPLPFVVVDGRRIKQVILNLMSNAVKFTPPGGRITLRSELCEPKGLMISVSDTGIGMTKEEVKVALEQFGQIDSEFSRNHDGTGLGLPIAKSLAEMHGGSVEVDSKRDAGTTVTLWLPLTRVVGTHESNASPDALADVG